MSWWYTEDRLELGFNVLEADPANSPFCWKLIMLKNTKIHCSEIFSDRVCGSIFHDYYRGAASVRNLRVRESVLVCVPSSQSDTGLFGFHRHSKCAISELKCTM